MVREFAALRGVAARTSGGGDENAPAEPGTTSRPPLRTIQPPAPGAPRWSLPTARKGLGVRTAGRVLGARAGAVRTSLAPRKPGARPASRSELTTTAGTSSVEEPSGKRITTMCRMLRQHCANMTHAPAKVEDCSDEDFVKNSEDVLKLHLELDIFKTILVEEKAAHAEVEQRTTALGDELKGLRYVIEVLESDLVRSIKESVELKKTNDRTLEKDEVCRQAEVETAEVIISLQQQLASKSLEFDDLLSDRQLLEAQMLKNNEKLAALEGDLAKTFDELNIVSTENAQLKSQLKRIGRTSCTVEELAHKNKIVGKLEEDLIELRNLRNELSNLSNEKQCCKAQVLKGQLEMAQIAEKWKAYAEEKDKEVKLLERSIEDLEITVCELENKVNIVKEEAKHERMQREELELKLWNIKQQKLVVPSFGNASSSHGVEMVNLVDSIRYSKDIQNELLGAQEVSQSKPEIGPVQEGRASCMIRRKQCIGMMPPFEELMQGAKQRDGEYCADASSSGDISRGSANASFSYLHALPKTTKGAKPNPYPTVEVTAPPMVGAESAPQTEDPCEPNEESSLDEGLLDPEQTDAEMEDAYRPEISEFGQSSPIEHLEQYSVSEQPELHGVGVDSDQSQPESRSEEQLPPSSVGPVVEFVEENELPPSAPVRPNDPVNYTRAPSDELKRLRSRNHYEGQRTATDRRFWSIEQQDLYTSIYSMAKLVDMKWIDWDYIDSIEQFAGVRKRCAHLGLEQIMSYRCHWDSELIRQFYSTVHISADRTSMTWMTDGRKITTNKRAWEERFSIPSGAHTEIHSQLFLNDDDKRTLYTAVEYTLGHIKGLSPLASIANKILGTTIYPRFGNTPRIGNTTHFWNVLYHIVEQHQFDIISLIFGEIESLISDHNRTKDKLHYAPYIMGMIMRAFEYEGPRESRHSSYKPKPPYKPKLSTKSHPPAAPAVVSPGEAARLELTPSAFQPEVAAAGREAYVEPVDVDGHHQFEAYRPHAVAVQGQAVLAQPITHTDLFQVVENGLRPIRDTVASMEGRIGRVEEGASVPAQHICSSSSSQVQASSSSLAPSLHATTSPAPPQAPRTTSLPSEQPSVLYTRNPGVSDQLVHVRPSPFSGFRWYQKK